MNKSYKVIVEVSVKHLDSVPALLQEVANCMHAESDAGMLEKEDGDKVVWKSDIK